MCRCWTIKNENTLEVSKEDANSYRGPPPRTLLLMWGRSGEPPQRLDDDIVFEGSEDDKFLALHQPTIRSIGASSVVPPIATPLTTSPVQPLAPIAGSVAGSPAGSTKVPGSFAGKDLASYPGLFSKDPSWPLLISIEKPDGSTVRIKDAIVDFHDKDKCIEFAHILLKSHQDVLRIVNDSPKQEKKDFVRAVLDKWLSSGSSSWQQLVDSMRAADMDKTAIKEIAKIFFL